MDRLLGKALRYHSAFLKGDVEEANRLSDELADYGKTVSCEGCRVMAVRMQQLGKLDRPLEAKEVGTLAMVVVLAPGAFGPNVN